MEYITQHGYNPFKGHFLGFLSPGSNESNKMRGFILEDIDLYHQPVEGPNIASLFFLLKLVIVVIGLYVNNRVLKVMKRQNGLLTDITMFLTYAQIIICPINLIFSTIGTFVHPLNEIIGDWYCHSASFLTDFYGNLILSHSMFCAMMRYVFILHYEKVQIYGVDKAKRYFLILYIVYTLIGLIWVRLEGPELSIIHNVNRCFGKDHKIFLLETSTLNVLKHRFWKYSQAGITIPIQNFSYDEILLFLGSISKALRMTLFCIMGFNVVEGILYHQILGHMNREHKRTMTNLSKLLSSSRKAMRHRRNLINIQITIFSWCTEFLCFSGLFLASYLLGHENNIIVFCMQTLGLILYFIVLPCIILMNDSNVKARVSDSSLYIKIISMFNCQYSNTTDD